MPVSGSVSNIHSLLNFPNVKFSFNSKFRETVFTTEHHTAVCNVSVCLIESVFAISTFHGSAILSNVHWTHRLGVSPLTSMRCGSRSISFPQSLHTNWIRSVIVFTSYFPSVTIGLPSLSCLLLRTRRKHRTSPTGLRRCQLESPRDNSNAHSRQEPPDSLYDYPNYSD